MQASAVKDCTMLTVIIQTGMKQYIRYRFWLQAVGRLWLASEAPAMGICLDTDTIDATK